MRRDERRIGMTESFMAWELLVLTMKKEVGKIRWVVSKR
jgi:hypothetical protein